MSIWDLMLDGLLAVTVLWLGWRVLARPDLFKSIVFFVAFGLVMALIWVRLEAPDVALAEAAIGAGLTGALFLVALSRLRRLEASTPDTVETPAPVTRSLGLRLSLAGMALLLFTGLGVALLSLPVEAPGLSGPVADNLSASGVSNPVTAVLLNFRGYDTLLEMGVLFLAVVAVWSLTPAPRETLSPPGAVLDAFVRVLFPVMILVAGYLLWVGAHAPGGAFQAGAVLAASAVMLLLSGRTVRPRWQGRLLRAVLSLGLGLFIVIGLAVMIVGLDFLEYPLAQAGTLILLIELAAALSIGATLAALFIGGRFGSDRFSDEERTEGKKNG